MKRHAPQNYFLLLGKIYREGSFDAVTRERPEEVPLVRTRRSSVLGGIWGEEPKPKAFLGTLHVNPERDNSAVEKLLRESFALAPAGTPVTPQPLIKEWL